MKKRDKHQAIKYILFLTFIAFLVWGSITIVFWDVEFIFDRFFTAAAILAAFLLYDKMRLNAPIVIFSLLTLLMHHLKLYGNFYAGIPFDRIMHFTAGVALSLIFFHYFTTSRIRTNFLATALLAILVATGLGSMMEIMEFVGYSFLGEGEGLLFYGTGDFGEWNNSSWDMISNTLGAVLAIIVYPLLMKLETLINKKT